ncbi:MAG: rhodanese-like domain-containing protein, partial [bacterium]|nr:rhodanese-like domain-containing protein [bacterium]
IKQQKQTRLFKDVIFKDSAGDGKGFTKLKVKVRDEVVTLGVGPLNIKRDTAPVVTAAQLEKMYQKEEDFVVLDLRNDFEVKAGYFEKTVNPELKNFRDLPGKMKELSYLKDPSTGSGQAKKIVAVCTGGIRCEKATALLKKEGFKNLRTLEDGIWAYMKKYPGKRFKGTLFTFDNRMTTPVVDMRKRDMVGQCAYCATKCETFYNDDSTRPSRKVICCNKCILRRKHILRPAVSV